MNCFALLLTVLLSVTATALLLAGVIALLRRFALPQEAAGSAIQDRMLARSNRPKLSPWTAIENTTTK